MTTEDLNGMATLTIRIPKALNERLRERADQLERSVNWMVKDSIVRILAAEIAAPWPPDSTGGRTLYGTTVRWYMPNFGQQTEDRIDLALSRACQVLQDQGAERIVVDGPWSEMPLPMRDAPVYYGEGVTAVNRYPQ